MITYYFRTIKDTGLKTLSEPRTGVWIHAVNPTKEELLRLQTDCGLDEDILDDALDFFEVPRVERVGSNTYFFTRYPYHDKTEDIDTAPLLLVVGETFILTISVRPIPPLDRFVSSSSTSIITTQKSKLFIQCMTHIIRSYDTELIQLRKGVHRDRGRLREIGTRGVERLVQYENRLNGIVEALMPTTQWLSSVAKGNYLQ